MKTKNRLLANGLYLLVVVFCIVGVTACGEDDEFSHQWGEWKTTTSATCTEGGVQERKCSECEESETSATKALGHDWNEATCSAPKTCKTCSTTEGAASAHAYTVEAVKNEALKSAANCMSGAVYYKSCTCGAISTSDADTFTAISATGNHNYVDGFCDACGKEEADCDHTTLYGESIDFGKLGACDWILYYDACECGEVKNIDAERFNYWCDFAYGEYNEYTDGNGNEYGIGAWCCSVCGMEFIATGIYVENGCTITEKVWSTFIVDDATIIDDAYVEAVFPQHSAACVTIDLSEYGACGGSLIVYMCENCEEITEIAEVNVDCDVDLEPEAEEVTDENGVVHYIQKVECPDCGLKFVTETWEVQESTCIIHKYQTTYIYSGDECFDFTYDYINSNHNYERQYELKGETCRDGYCVNNYCLICGERYKHYAWGHLYSERKVDFEDLGLCGGHIGEMYCLICNKVVNYSISDEWCRWEWVETNADGYSVYNCPECGATKLYSGVSEQIENCQKINTNIYIYIVNGEEIYGYEISYTNTSHNYKFEFVMNGSSCTDGYIEIAICEDCDEYYENTFSYHHEYTRFELGKDYECCDKHYLEDSIAIYSCPCGEIYDIYFYGSTLSYDAQLRIYVCEDCDLSVEHSARDIEQGGSIVEVTTIVVTLSGKVICSYEYI